MVPTNHNFLSPLGYKFILDKAPTVNYNVQRVSLPGIQLSDIPVATPFVALHEYGKIAFNELQMTFRVSEDMVDYLELHNWMVSLGTPRDFDQSKAVKTKRSDITVYIMNSSMQPNVKVQYFDAFPISVGDLEMNTTDSDVNYIECSASFAYTRYEITKL